MGGKKSNNEVCGGISFRTWLVIFAILAIGLIRSMLVRPAATRIYHTTVPVPGGTLVSAESADAPVSAGVRASS